MLIRELLMLLTTIFIVFGLGYLTAEKKYTNEKWIEIFFD